MWPVVDKVAPCLRVHDFNWSLLSIFACEIVSFIDGDSIDGPMLQFVSVNLFSSRLVVQQSYLDSGAVDVLHYLITSHVVLTAAKLKKIGQKKMTLEEKKIRRRALKDSNLPSFQEHIEKQ